MLFPHEPTTEIQTRNVEAVTAREVSVGDEIEFCEYTAEVLDIEDHGDIIRFLLTNWGWQTYEPRWDVARIRI